MISLNLAVGIMLFGSKCEWNNHDLRELLKRVGCLITFRSIKNTILTLDLKAFFNYGLLTAGH
jgi:hypothetical protein